MTEATKPDWLKNWKPDESKQKGGNPNWYPGMKSPNPAGRPKGITDKRVRIAKKMLDDADGIVAVMTEKALEGDTGAASLVLSRVLPALRGQTEKVEFAFDASAPVTEQIEAVLSAIAAGTVAADVGRQIIDAIGTLSNARAVEELEQRILALEVKEAV
ncbi:MAG: DUF5681 domain-containing protein [Pseudomonadota bacterium]